MIVITQDAAYKVGGGSHGGIEVEKVSVIEGGVYRAAGRGKWPVLRGDGISIAIGSKMLLTEGGMPVFTTSIVQRCD